ncbi:MAG: NAD+ synthase [Candidatus Omnitrophica bacterium]|nr:NAD+ synthase [Candidatus Omnitrophota bacterium]
MKITIAQLNPIIGDVPGNCERLLDLVAEHSRTSELIIFPELFLVGYPPRDLLKNKTILESVQTALNAIRGASRLYSQIGILVGTPLPTGKHTGRGLHNAAILFHNGKEVGRQCKTLLPSYDVFDEVRYFDVAPVQSPIEFMGEKLGVTVCEDMWNDPRLWDTHAYTTDPVSALARQRATIMINISASPFYAGKEKIRHRLITNHAKRYKIPFIFVNQVGANDELIFDGGSVVVNRAGNVNAVLDSFKEEVRVIDTKKLSKKIVYRMPDAIASIHSALVLGIRDYIRKCGFEKVVIGLSGGVDSALTCALAVEALGKENVLGISMPSQFSSQGSVNDSMRLAQNLGCEFKVVPIATIFATYLRILRVHIQEKTFGLMEENLQARVRGNVLMAFSNKYGHLVLSTGNKSELAVGYCTLYGDMSGGLSVISDVPKGMVYKLAKYINRKKEVIPRVILKKVPSAELRPNQCDQDTLPPYEVLDKILHHYIEEGDSLRDIIRKGFDRKTVQWVISTVNKNEHKRRQAAPGLKVTSKAFGSGRRFPIAARYES